MGLFSSSSSHGHHGSSSRHRSSSHGDKYYMTRPSVSRSASSFFRLANPSSASIFSTGSTRSHHSSSSSYYKRRPRSGFISGLWRKLRHLLRELMYYAKRHPVKVFMLVVMPLISGGVLAGFARQFGIRLPAALSGSAARGMSGGYYGSAGYGGVGGGVGEVLGGMGGAAGVGNLLSIAKNFL